MYKESPRKPFQKCLTRWFYSQLISNWEREKKGQKRNHLFVQQLFTTIISNVSPTRKIVRNHFRTYYNVGEKIFRPSNRTTAKYSYLHAKRAPFHVPINILYNGMVCTISSPPWPFSHASHIIVKLRGDHYSLGWTHVALWLFGYRLQ